MPGLAFGRLFDMGYLRLPVGLASALLVACTFLTGECTEFWHFLLCQGFGIGVSRPHSFIHPRLPTILRLLHSLRVELCSVQARASLLTGLRRTSAWRWRAWRVAQASVGRSSQSYSGILSRPRGTSHYYFTRFGCMLNPHYSFQWTLRITGFIVAAFLLVLNLVSHSQCLVSYIVHR